MKSPKMKPQNKPLDYLGNQFIYTMNLLLGDDWFYHYNINSYLMIPDKVDYELIKYLVIEYYKRNGNDLKKVEMAELICNYFIDKNKTR